MEEISAGGVVVYKDKVCLLRKYRGEWVLPKGRNEAGESLEETALREVYEESGLKGQIVRYLGFVKYWYRHCDGEKVQKTVHYYYMKTENKIPVPQKEEGFSLAQFMSFDKALGMISHNSEANMIKNTKFYFDKDK